MIAQLDPFHAIAVSTLAHRLARQGQDIIHMEFGQPSTGAPAKAIAAAHEVLDTDPMGYWESQALKARIARHYLETAGVTVDPSRIVLTCGASPALVMALSLIGGPGARVAFARPGYVAYRNNARALFMEPVEVPCGDASGYQIDAVALAALEPAPDAVIIASPANPTGTIIPADELARIAQVCRERGIRIISDEIYQGITFFRRRAEHPGQCARCSGGEQFLEIFQHAGLASGLAGDARRSGRRGAGAHGQPVPDPAGDQPESRARRL
jgi:aspartate/methionine/tyrosine aminotransferase